ncbi:hypothetical protein [Spirillospora sp. NPDC048824]|uniref:hypothetical protein n=1 Tax=Spirillospora sp. NPDC048824 TaxID=3364526 RepID=UPI003716A737
MPAPLRGGSDLEDERHTWILLRRLLAELPTGSWTTFGDLATVIGSNPAGVGHSAMLLLYARTKTEAVYNASAFLGMVTEHGGVGAAKRLLASPHISDGFTGLHERGHLDLTVEAHAIDPRFVPLFTGDERDRAHHRLTEAGYRP